MASTTKGQEGSPRKAMSDPIPLTPHISDSVKERRIVEIRREAESKGTVAAKGIRPGGAPFPVASPETGCYGIPLLKQPAWTWEIPLYFFVGGAAGASAVVFCGDISCRIRTISVRPLRSIAASSSN